MLITLNSFGGATGKSFVGNNLTESFGINACSLELKYRKQAAPFPLVKAISSRKINLYYVYLENTDKPVVSAITKLKQLYGIIIINFDAGLDFLQKTLFRQSSWILHVVNPITLDLQRLDKAMDCYSEEEKKSMMVILNNRGICNGILREQVEDKTSLPVFEIPYINNHSKAAQYFTDIRNALHK